MVDIKKHEKNSVFETDGRTFVINAYDPIEGNYILFQIVSFVLPFGIGKLLSSSVGGTEKIPTSDTNSKMMSKADFIQLQKDILSTVFEKYESGEKSPVVRENGTYGISNFTMSLSINLIVASLAFNFKDFFEEFPSLENLI